MASVAYELLILPEELTITSVGMPVGVLGRCWRTLIVASGVGHVYMQIRQPTIQDRRPHAQVREDARRRRVVLRHCVFELRAASPEDADVRSPRYP